MEILTATVARMRVVTLALIYRYGAKNKVNRAITWAVLLIEIVKILIEIHNSFNCTGCEVRLSFDLCNKKLHGCYVWAKLTWPVSECENYQSPFLLLEPIILRNSAYNSCISSNRI